MDDTIVKPTDEELLVWKDVMYDEIALEDMQKRIFNLSRQVAKGRHDIWTKAFELHDEMDIAGEWFWDWRKEEYRNYSELGDYTRRKSLKELKKSMEEKENV